MSSEKWRQSCLSLNVLTKYSGDLDTSTDEIFLVDEIILMLRQMTSIFTSKHENSEVFLTWFHLIKAIYKHCPIHFYSTVLIAAPLL